MRPTRQRAAVARALGGSETFRSAQEVHDDLLHEGDKVGLTTVYRTLQAMANAGEVDVLRTGDGEAVYRQCRSEAHHHHLVCRSCGRTVELEADEVEAWTRKVARRHGFREASHVLEVFGVCRDCQPNASG